MSLWSFVCLFHSLVCSGNMTNSILLDNLSKKSICLLATSIIKWNLTSGINASKNNGEICRLLLLTSLSKKYLFQAVMLIYLIGVFLSLEPRTGMQIRSFDFTLTWSNWHCSGNNLESLRFIDIIFKKKLKMVVCSFLFKTGLLIYSITSKNSPIINSRSLNFGSFKE